MKQGQANLQSGLILPEQSFISALQSPKIISASFEQMMQVLMKVIMKVGVRANNLPDELERSVLIEHILKNFGGNTLKEIELAFDMAISCKLDVEANCFENFSCIYFSKIMTAYRSWAIQEYKYVSNKREESLMLENSDKLSDEEMEEWVGDWRQKIETVKNPILIPPLFYDYLDRIGELRLTTKQKMDYMRDNAVSLRYNQLAYRIESEGNHSKAKEELIEFNKMREAGCFTGDEYNRLKELAKKIAVFYHLKNKNNEM